MADSIMQNDENYIMSKEYKPCWICGKLTNRIEINYEAPICSYECEKIADKGYWEALKKMGALNAE